jgi:hypothetical protein
MTRGVLWELFASAHMDYSAKESHPCDHNEKSQSVKVRQANILENYRPPPHREVGPTSHRLPERPSAARPHSLRLYDRKG